MANTEPVTMRRTDRAEAGLGDLMGELRNLRAPLAGDVALTDVIDPMVEPGELYEPLPDGVVHCYACAHNCKIKPGGRGICQVRYNLNGTLYVPYGYVAALQSDPTEKKPFFHIHPGSDTLTFGMMGCDLHCSYCQNWHISQALRDINAGEPPVPVSPEQLLQVAKQAGSKCFASSYNEPLITSEWSQAVFRLAKAAGYTTMYVSNGNATRGVLEYIRPQTDGYKIDLKTMNPKNYRSLGAVLDNVLGGVRMAHELGFWVEIVTLVVPGFNDSEAELRDAAQFIKSVSPDIPWHVTAFHQDYRMQDHEGTNAHTLIRAAEMGYAEGLRYVYAGNQPGRVGDYENTYCPQCRALLIERLGFVVTAYRLTGEGACPACGTQIPGIWPASPAEVRLGTPADLYFRMPRAVRLRS